MNILSWRVTPLIAAIFLGVSTVSVAAPDATVESELEILHIKEHAKKVRVRVDCRDENPVNQIREIFEAFESLGDKRASPAKPRNQRGHCTKMVDQITYDVTVGFAHKGKVRRKTLRGITEYPGRVGDTYPVLLDIHIRKNNLR